MDMSSKPAEGQPVSNETEPKVDGGGASDQHDNISNPNMRSQSPNASADSQRLTSLKTRNASLEETLAALTSKRADLIAALAALPSVADAAQTPTQNAKERDEQSPSFHPDRAVAEPSPFSSFSEGAAIPEDAAVLAAAKSIVRRHIALLHSYNAVRDVGQGLMGLIADGKGVRIKEVQEEFGMDADD